MAKVKKEVSPFVLVEEQPFTIPENWCWVYAPSIFEIVYGKGLASKELKESGYPVFGANGQIGYYDNYMYEESQALMSCRGAYSGTMNKSLPKSYVTSNSLVISNLGSAMDADYICYLFSALDVKRLVSGSAQPQVTVQAFANFPIPLVPEKEQKRIVDRIESLFAKLDEAREKAQAVVDEYEQRKAAILHRAFTGELTNVWRRQNGINDASWIDCELVDVLLDRPRNGYSPKPVSYVTPYKSMTLSATTSGEFLPEHFKYIDEEIPADSYLWLEPGDILVQRANSLEKVGTSAVYTGSSHEFIYPDLIMKLQVKEGIMPEYIAYQLKTSSALSYMRGHATGTAGNMPKINQKIVSSVPIKMTTFEEQREIVCILRKILGKEQQAKEIAESVIEKIDIMKKSILARAFRGELGTNDPTDESAEVLLKKIL